MKPVTNDHGVITNAAMLTRGRRHAPPRGVSDVCLEGMREVA